MQASRLFTAAALAFALAACGAPATETAEAETASAAPAKTPAGAPVLDAFDTDPVTGANYGAGVADDANPMAYEDFVQLVATHDTVRATVTGTVVKVCQKKGCWMTLQPSGATAEADEPYMVRFKDYGFFMPKTLSGREVVVAGVARTAVTPVEELRHYAEDAGKRAAEVAAITEPRTEVSLEAVGVRVL